MFLLASMIGAEAFAQGIPGLTAAPPSDEGPVSVRLVVSKSPVRPGDQLAVAIDFDLAPGWHLHTNEPKLTPSMVRESFSAVPTTVSVPQASGAMVGPIQWPQTHAVMVDLTGSGRPESYGVFEGEVTIFVPIMVAPDATGQVTLDVEFGWQACDDRFCVIPELKTERVTIPVTTGPDTGSTPIAMEGATPAAPEAFAAFDVGVFGRATEFASSIKKATPASATFNVFGGSFTVDTSGALGLSALLALAMLGGFVLNLTPCVLPVIPIKIMGLSAAASNPARCFFLGVVMSAGVVAFWLGIGQAINQIAGFSAVNALFQRPWFSIVVGLVIGLMGLGMFGLFTAGLPQWVYRINPKHDSVHGSFLFGIMTAVLSTPCTAPFMGSAAAWATQQDDRIRTLLTFGAIGVGMALPYLILAANPRLVNKVPRTGPASELVKQVMGLLMIGVAIFFLGTGIGPFLMTEVGDPPLRAHWWGVAACAVAAGGWLAFQSFRISKRLGSRLLVGMLGLGLAVSAVAVAAEQNDRGPVAWQAWTPERFAAARATGKVIVVDFTAEWCLNCKALEASVLHRKEVAGVLNGDGVVPMKVDITAGYPEGVAFMKELRWANVPLLAIFGPGSRDPQKFDSYTPSTVLGAIDRAQAGATGGG
jgi:thiol:disulfide interchange protein